MSTDTPRCDALDDDVSPDTNGRDGWKSAYFRLLALARQLERELAQARAECENLRQEMREYEHHVMTGRNEQHDRLVAETERLRAEVEAMIDKFYERMTSMKALLDQGSYHMVAAKLIADISALEAARAKP